VWLFGWGRQTVELGSAGGRVCRRCSAAWPVQTWMEYRYFHVMWLVGAILTRKYQFSCSGCGVEVEARSSRLKRIARSGHARFIPLGPIFLIWLGGALVLIGPGDYSD